MSLALLSLTPARHRCASSVIFTCCTNKYCNSLLPQRGVMRGNLLLLLMLPPHKSSADSHLFPVWRCWAMELANLTLSSATMWFHVSVIDLFVFFFFFNDWLFKCQGPKLLSKSVLVWRTSVVGTEINLDENIHWPIRVLHCQLVAATKKLFGRDTTV